MKKERVKIKETSTTRRKRRIFVSNRTITSLMKVMKRLRDMFYSWTKKQSPMKMKTITTSQRFKKMKMWMLILKENYFVL
jgi:hypothetical protein